MINEENDFGFEAVSRARQRIQPFIHRTPVLTSNSLEVFCGGAHELFFKCENFQKTGSFKARGALNAILCALERNPSLEGVCTHSSGNHGQALAWAASKLGLKCVVVVPESAPDVKLDAIRAYSAQLISCESTMAARWKVCEMVSKERSFPIIDPHNDYDVMAGQGTIAAELLEQVPDLDAIIVSAGGGGLCTGIATYAKSLKPEIKVFCAEAVGKELQSQLISGQHKQSSTLLATIADGIRIIQIGTKCFPYLLKFVEKTVFSLTDEEIRSATLLIWQRLKILVEPSAALPLSAVLKYGSEEPLNKCRKIGLILCGGNVLLKENAIF